MCSKLLSQVEGNILWIFRLKLCQCLQGKESVELRAQVEVLFPVLGEGLSSDIFLLNTNVVNLSVVT